MSTSKNFEDEGVHSVMIGYSIKGDPKSRHAREESPTGYISADIPLLLAYGFLKVKKDPSDSIIKTSFFSKLQGVSKEYEFVNTNKQEILQFLRWATTKASIRHGIPPLLINFDKFIYQCPSFHLF